MAAKTNEPKKRVAKATQPTETTQIEEVIKETPVEVEKKETVVTEESPVNKEKEVASEEPAVEDIPTVKTIEEAINEVKTDIKIAPTEAEAETQEKAEESLNRIDELIGSIEEVRVARETLNEKIEANPDNAKEILEEELKKAEAIKTKTQAMLKRLNNSRFTATWNGLNYDI